jgi:hypothetical protein
MLKTLRDSIETSVSMNLFPDLKTSSERHIFHHEFCDFMIKDCFDLENFDPSRLQSSAVKAYPLSNRPRGAADIQSVKHHQKLIREKKPIEPIFIVVKNNRYILTDGAHRIVASFIEKKKNIPCCLIFF